MSTALAQKITKRKSDILTDKERIFVIEYLLDSNGSRAVLKAGYKSKAPGTYASALLDKPKIQREISRQLEERESRKVAKPTEILQFYTSVMRGEVLDQFGIEASLDTRIKAANELAKQQIEIPMKLEQKNITNNIGSITLNFTPREEIEAEVV